MRIQGLSRLLEKSTEYLSMFIYALLLIFSAFITVCALIVSSRCLDMDTQTQAVTPDNPFVTVILLGTAFFIIYVSIRYVFKKSGSCNTLLLLLVLCEYMFGGLYLIVFSKTMPAADSGSVYWMADALSRGDLSIIDPVNSYLTYYPQQIGLTSLLAVFIKAVGVVPINIAGFHLVKIFYILMVLLTIFIMYKTVGLLWKDDRISKVFLMLVFASFYYCMYSTFIYSEIPSILMMSLSFYLFVSAESSGKRTYFMMITSACCCVLAVFLRKNALIFAIAMLIVQILCMFKRKKAEYIIAIIITIAGSLFLQPLVITVYEAKAGRQLTDGVTTASYIAMGMQEGGRSSGWYNGYNYNTYTESNLDKTLADAASKKAIKDRLIYFNNNKSEAIAFYARKLLSQWTDGTYACAQATYASYGRSELAEKMYTGSLYNVYMYIADAVMNVVYIGFLITVIYAFAKRGKEELFILLPGLFVLGGFMFHMFWEANSRYILTYAIFELMYAPFGIVKLIECIEDWAKKGQTNNL